MRQVKVAALQMSMSTKVDENIATAERLVRNAAKQGAQIILIPELFERHYFCKDQTTLNSLATLAKCSTVGCDDISIARVRSSVV